MREKESKGVMVKQIKLRGIEMRVIVFSNQFELVGTGLLRLKKTETWSFMVPVTVLHSIRSTRTGYSSAPKGPKNRTGPDFQILCTGGTIKEHRLGMTGTVWQVNHGLGLKARERKGSRKASTEMRVLSMASMQSIQAGVADSVSAKSAQLTTCQVAWYLHHGWH